MYSTADLSCTAVYPSRLCNLGPCVEHARHHTQYTLHLEFLVGETSYSKVCQTARAPAAERRDLPPPTSDPRHTTHRVATLYRMPIVISSLSLSLIVLEGRAYTARSIEAHQTTSSPRAYRCASSTTQIAPACVRHACCVLSRHSHAHPARWCRHNRCHRRTGWKFRWQGMAHREPPTTSPPARALVCARRQAARVRPQPQAARGGAQGVAASARQRRCARSRVPS